MIELLSDYRLWCAATPAFVGVGMVIAYILATETGDLDSVPDVQRGGSVDEPWGVPQPVRKHTLPGANMLVLPRDQARKYDTRELTRVQD